MDTESLAATVQIASPTALAFSFMAGLMFSFNQVALAAMPVSLAYATKARAPRQALVLGGTFLVGMLLAPGLLGAAAGLGGPGGPASAGPILGAAARAVADPHGPGLARVGAPAPEGLGLARPPGDRAGGRRAGVSTFRYRHLPRVHAGTGGTARGRGRHRFGPVGRAAAGVRPRPLRAGGARCRHCRLAGQAAGAAAPSVPVRHRRRAPAVRHGPVYAQTLFLVVPALAG